MRTTSAWLAAFFAGCGGAPPVIQGDGEPADCKAGETYPPGEAAVMTLGETLPKFRWPEAIDRATGLRTALDLGDAPCATDAVIDWSPFDVLLFVSLPAW